MSLTEKQTTNAQNVIGVLTAVAANLGDGSDTDIEKLCDSAINHLTQLSDDEKASLKWNAMSTFRHILNITS